MLSYWDHLAENNDPPNDSTINELRKLLSEPSKQLEDIKLEIKRLEAKQLEIEEYVRSFHRILAPIRRVPYDILRTIFEHCLPTHRNPTMSGNEAPMLLTHVCRTWRSIAHQSPRLWAHIYVPFRNVTKGYDNNEGFDDPLIPQQQMVSVLQNRCYAVQEWLSRSGDLPLSISVMYEQGSPFVRFVTGNTNSSSIDNLVKMLLRTLLLFSPRWRSLEIVLPDNIHRDFEDMLSTHTLPLLLRLRLSIISQRLLNAPFRPSPSKNLLRAPNLKYLSLEGPKHNITQLISPTHTSQSLTGGNISITHVSLSRCGLDTCIVLFKGYPTLIQCDLTTRHDAFEIENEIIIPNAIHLPHLRALWIKTSGNIGPNSFVPSLLEVLDCPRLRNFGYYNDVWNTTAASDEIPPSFFYRAINLTSLELDRFCLRPSNILDILKAQHRLIRLSLTSKYRMEPSKPSSLEIETFDLDALVIRRDTDGGPITSTSASTHHQLLPCLEVFELHRTTVTDDLVLRFVTSRMDPESDIAVLKKVKIFFDRYEEHHGLDLVKEIRTRADRKDIQIDTSFCYVGSTIDAEKKRNNLLPAHTAPTRQFDNRTWTHEEHFDSEYDD
ncbi:hypothetical protein JR316_0008817 [Psilocybe cubensis]|uniref:Uncharacterized protein n=2 Tax=Psilocybe cubensis TaxID=181762 RepID=A0ACB8GS47_PSICU|nr:hypothetical protein JR316_0008817 [Psilocybe cubensis]KAH9478363.1 hypothetical protein JR316_0008817 [Psilocybe cubensis]